MYTHARTHTPLHTAVFPFQCTTLRYFKIFFMMVLLHTITGVRFGSCEIFPTQVSSDYLLGGLSACNLYVIVLNKDYYLQYYYYY